MAASCFGLIVYHLALFHNYCFIQSCRGQPRQGQIPAHRRGNRPPESHDHSWYVHKNKFCHSSLWYTLFIWRHLGSKFAIYLSDIFFFLICEASLPFISLVFLMSYAERVLPFISLVYIVHSAWCVKQVLSF